MSNYQNHLIDPTFFWDAIEEFSFDYDLYTENQDEVDEYGNTKRTYTKRTVRGSLQSQGKRMNRSTEGNTTTFSYGFYCKSIYRIDIGDILEYKNNYFIVTGVHDYDEFGCRSCDLNSIDLVEYRDFSDYVDYLQGEKII